MNLHIKTCLINRFENIIRSQLQILELRMLWYDVWGRGHYYPYLITCRLPPQTRQVKKLMSVSVVSEKCENATNNLNIMHRDRYREKNIKTRHQKNTFGVCVKALDFPHGYMLSRLVEWIEALRLLGADKIFFYEFYVDSNIKKASWRSYSYLISHWWCPTYNLIYAHNVLGSWLLREQRNN